MSNTLGTPLARGGEESKCHLEMNDPKVDQASRILACRSDPGSNSSIAGVLSRQEYKRLIEHFRIQLGQARASAVHAADNYGQAAIEYGLGMGQGMASNSLGDLFEARSAVETPLIDLEREFIMGAEKIESLIYGPEY